MEEKLLIVTSKKRRRVARGLGSGWGKTAGRGSKGQNSRTGNKFKPGFEGGQTKLTRRLPKLSSFRAPERKVIEVLNILDLAKIQKTDINKTDLAEAGIIKNKSLVKLLSAGDIDRPVKLEVDMASKVAIEKVNKAGGEVILTFTPKKEKATKK